MTPYIQGLISSAAQKYGLDPSLLNRVASAESGGDPGTVSPAGAMGVMQLMPQTARGLGVDPSDPAQNIDGGAHYLKQQLDRFGSPELALAAYNAGPGRVARAGGVPNIPETQAYVAKIMGGGGPVAGRGGADQLAGGSGADIFGLDSPKPQQGGSGADIFGDVSAPSQAPKMDKAAPFPSAASVAALGRPSVANDIRHTISPSLQQGASSILGMLGDLRDMPGKVNSAAVDFLVGHGLASPQAGNAVKAAVTGAQRAVMGGPTGLGNPLAASVPNSAQVNAARQGVVGKDYIPQTIPGQYVRTAGQFAPAAILPGSIAQRATNVLLPAITSETAGQVTKGTPYEEAARFVGGLVGGVRAPGAAATVESLPGLPGRMAARSIVDPTAVQVLKNAGVKLTPGQQLGGIAKNVEDLGMRAPILGPAISGARQRGNVSLNRAVANDALSDIGETVPANVATGHDSTAFVAERLGKVYDRAADMVPSVAPDAEFNVGLNEIDKHVGELPTDVGAQYRTILQNRLFSRLGNGPVTGAQLRQIQSEIGTIAAERAASGDGAQQALGHMLEGVSDNLKGLLGRANPEAGALIQQANAGWSKYVRIRNATAKTPSGIYTPGQLATAVRTMDKSVGKGNVAKGQAVLQDLSKAASTVMPDQFGNPGTANALGLGGMMVGATTAPVQTAVTAAGLGAVATPYALMARNISKAVPRTAPTTAQIAKAQALLEAHARRQLPPGLTPLVPSALLGGVLAR